MLVIKLGVSATQIKPKLRVIGVRPLVAKIDFRIPCGSLQENCRLLKFVEAVQAVECRVVSKNFIGIGDGRFDFNGLPLVVQLPLARFFYQFNQLIVAFGIRFFVAKRIKAQLNIGKAIAPLFPPTFGLLVCKSFLFFIAPSLVILFEVFDERFNVLTEFGGRQINQSFKPGNGRVGEVTAFVANCFECGLGRFFCGIERHEKVIGFLSVRRVEFANGESVFCLGRLSVLLVDSKGSERLQILCGVDEFA